MGLDCRPGRHSPGVQSPAFAKRGAVADFDRDVAASRIQVCPKRIDLSNAIGFWASSWGVNTLVDSPTANTRPLMSLSSPGWYPGPRIFSGTSAQFLTG